MTGFIPFLLVFSLKRHLKGIKGNLMKKSLFSVGFAINSFFALRAYVVSYFRRRFWGSSINLNSNFICNFFNTKLFELMKWWSWWKIIATRQDWRATRPKMIFIANSRQFNHVKTSWVMLQKYVWTIWTYFRTSRKLWKYRLFIYFRTSWKTWKNTIDQDYVQMTKDTKILDESLTTIG